MLTGDETVLVHGCFYQFFSLLEQKFSLLDRLAVCEYHAIHGNCEVVRDENDAKGLAGWVGRQRRYHKAGTLSVERTRLLDELHFTWDVHESAWQKNLSALKEFIQQAENSNISPAYPKDPSLAVWVSKLRNKYSQGLLEQKKIDALNAIRFDLDPKTNQWLKEGDEVYQKLLSNPEILFMKDAMARNWWLYGAIAKRNQGKLDDRQSACLMKITSLVEPESVDALRNAPDDGFVDNKTYVARYARLMRRIEHDAITSKLKHLWLSMEGMTLLVAPESDKDPRVQKHLVDIDHASVIRETEKEIQYIEMAESASRFVLDQIKPDLLARRSKSVRLISVRRASRREREAYYR